MIPNILGRGNKLGYSLRRGNKQFRYAVSMQHTYTKLYVIVHVLISTLHIYSTVSGDKSALRRIQLQIKGNIPLLQNQIQSFSTAVTNGRDRFFTQINEHESFAPSDFAFHKHACPSNTKSFNHFT
jgi:hypothetical protein